MVLGKAASSCELIGVAEGAEEAVPPGDVAIIESVNVELVVDGVMFGTLKEVAHPMRGAEVAVVEVFADHGEDVEPGGSFGGDSEETEQQGTGEDGIGDDLDGMLVERGQHFDAGGAVVDLVKDAPERSELVTCAMPPIEDEGADEPAEQSLEECGQDAGDLEQ